MPSAPSLVGLVLAAGPALIDPIHPGEVIVGRVVTAQGEVGGGRNEKTGDVPAAGQAIERFSLQPLAIGCEGLEHPLGGPDQLQLQGGHQLATHLGGIGACRRKGSGTHGRESGKAETPGNRRCCEERPSQPLPS
jgi:hypothetical protein